MDKLKEWVILGLALVIMVLMLKGGCSKKEPNVIFKDSIRITHDTVFAKDTVIEFKKKFYPKWDSVFTVDTIRIEGLQMGRVYNDTVRDKNVDIFNRSEVIGMIKSSKVSYKLKVPLLITDSVFITSTVAIPPKVSLYAGLELSGNKDNFNLSPFLKLDVRKTTISARYGLLDKTVGIGDGN